MVEGSTSSSIVLAPSLCPYGMIKGKNRAGEGVLRDDKKDPAREQRRVSYRKGLHHESNGSVTNQEENAKQ